MLVDIKIMKVRVLHEAKEYLAVFLYLYACIGTLTLYKSLTLRTYGVDFVPYGFALIKALILAKFMLIGNLLPISMRFNQKPLIYPTVYNAFVFFILLLALSAVEEVITGLWHGRNVTESVLQLGGGTLPGVLAACFVTFVFLLPYFALRQLNAVLGKGRLFGLFFRSAGNEEASSYSTLKASNDS